MESEQYTLDDQRNIERTRKKILKFLESNENKPQKNLWDMAQAKCKRKVYDSNK